MGDIVRLGDFDAQTKDDQTTMFDTSKVMCGEVMGEEVCHQQRTINFL